MGVLGGMHMGIRRGFGECFGGICGCSKGGLIVVVDVGMHACVC